MNSLIFNLDETELYNPSVVKIRRVFENRLAAARIKLEGDSDELDTALLRSRIREYKSIISDLSPST